MDRAHAEIIAVEAATKEVFESSLQQLNDLELAAIGGGIADTILA